MLGQSSFMLPLRINRTCWTSGHATEGVHSAGVQGQASNQPLNRQEALTALSEAYGSH